MKYCVVHLLSQSASFRPPAFQNFHKSLLLPPPATLIGLAGAALGLSPDRAQDFFFDRDAKLGVWGCHRGQAKDLWKYSRDAHKYSPEAHMLGDNLTGIVQREVLFHNEFLVVYAMKNEADAEVLWQAFLQPAYALSMGNSDALAKVVSAETGERLLTAQTFHSCVLEGDVVARVMDKANVSDGFSIYVSSDPIAFDVPTRFIYADLAKPRTVARTQTYSFIGPEVTLNYEVQAVPWHFFSRSYNKMHNVVIPLISI